MSKENIMIGTWPTPEKWDQILEVIEYLGEVVKPIEAVEGISDIIREYRQKICKKLEASIRSDIGCLCKYQDANLCKSPKIKECLTRIIKTFPLYQRLCCER